MTCGIDSRQKKMKKFENKVFALWAKLICFFLHKDKQGLLNRRGKTCPWVETRRTKLTYG